MARRGSLLAALLLPASLLLPAPLSSQQRLELVQRLDLGRGEHRVRGLARHAALCELFPHFLLGDFVELVDRDAGSSKGVLFHAGGLHRALQHPPRRDPQDDVGGGESHALEKGDDSGEELCLGLENVFF